MSAKDIDSLAKESFLRNICCCNAPVACVPPMQRVHCHMIQRINKGSGAYNNVLKLLSRPLFCYT